MARNLEDLLAALADQELGQMQVRARADVEAARELLKRAEVEMDLINRALARKARRTGGGGGQGNATRDAVLAAFADGQSLSPAEVIAAVHARGVTVKEGAIRAMIRRVADEGHVHRLASGQYGPGALADVMASAPPQQASFNGDERDDEDQEATYEIESHDTPA